MYIGGCMKISNLSPRQIKNKIDKELQKDSRYNGNMSKVKEKTATTKDILLGFVKEQREFNDQQREFNGQQVKFNVEQKEFNHQQREFNTRIESKVDNLEIKVKQAHPELF